MMDNKRIKWIIPPLILLFLIIVVNIAYHKSRTTSVSTPNMPVVEEKYSTEQVPSMNTTEEEGLPSKAEETVSSPSSVSETLPSSQASSASKPFSLQIASFRDRKRAEEVLKRLQGKEDYPIRIVKKDLKGSGVWYRVWLGAFATKEEAAGVLEKIKKDYPDSFIVLHK